VQRGDAEFLVQYADAPKVRVGDSPPIAPPRVDAEQLLVGGLLEWVDVEPPFDGRHGSVEPSVRSLRFREFAEERRRLATLLLGDHGDPGVELGRVSEREALHELALASVEAPCEFGRVADRDIRTQHVDIDLDLVTVEAQGIRRLDQQVRAHRRPDRRQRAPERASSAAVVAVRPQQFRQRLASLLAIDGELGQDRKGFACVQTGGSAVDQNGRRPHELQADPTHAGI
jgi:hypothetical protein